MWQRFTQTSRQTIMKAEQEALWMRSAQVETEHLLLGLLQEGKSSGAQILQGVGITAEKVWEEIVPRAEPADLQQVWLDQEIEQLGTEFQIDPAVIRQIESRLLLKLRGQNEKSELKLSEQLKRVLELAADESRETQRVVNHASYIGTEHLLLGLLRQKDSVAAQTLNRLGLDLGQARVVVIEHLRAKAEE